MTTPATPTSLRGELLTSWRILVLAMSVLLVTVAGASGYLLFTLQPRLSQEMAMVRELRVAHEGLLDQETGLRAYIATGQGTFLQPYVRGRRETLAAEDRLLQRVGRQSDYADQVVRMLLAEEQWRVGWAEIAVRRPAGSAMTGDQLAAFLASGKEAFDRYRAEQSAVMNAALRQRDAVAAKQRRVLMGTGAANVSFVLVLMLVDARRRRRLQASVDAPIRELLAQMHRMHAGDLTPSLGHFAVEEFQRLGAGLSDMAQALDVERRRGAARQRAAEELAARLRVILRVARETAGSLSLFYVAETVAAAAVELGRDRAVVWVRSEPDGGFTAVRRSDDAHGVAPPVALEPGPIVAQAVADARVVRQGEDAYFPLVMGGLVVGVLETHDAPSLDDHLDERAQVDTVLEALALNAASALESARLNARTAEQATHDALTGLPNRRRLEVDVAREWDRARRYNRPLSVCMFDVDHFKAVNDGGGHVVGDAWLRQLGAILRDTLRDTDTAYRYGGEEFLLLLPESDVQAASAVAERLRLAVESAVGPAAWPTVTASFGVATQEPGMADVPDLIAAADEALYAAKRGGRNRVAVTGTSSPPVLMPV